MSGSTSVPLIMTAAGPQPTPVTTLQQNVIASATALAPGLTAALPGSMIEDMTSTAVAAVAQSDQSRVDVVNSVSPYAANGFILALIGAQLGIPQGQANNTSASVTFTVKSSGVGVSGFQVPAGVLVSDGTNQYATQSAVTTNASGVAGPVAVVATLPGSWAVAAGAINTVVTSFPSSYVVTVTNSSPGVAGTAAQSVQSYRAQVLQAEQIAVRGTPAFIAATLSALPGIQSRLIGTYAASGGLKVVCGLTIDQNLIAGAIYQSVPDVSTLQGSALAITGISAATNAVITTNTNSNVSTGTVLTVSGATPSAYNVSYTVTSVNGTAITTSTNSSGFGAYSSGATFNPNPRNVATTVLDGGNSYSITFVNPPAQAVTATVQWNTDLPNFASGSQVNELAATALVNYINSLQQGQSINIDVMTATFQQAVASVLTAQHLIALTFVIDINGVTVSPNVGTVIIPGDGESFFSATPNAFAVSQA